jgi:formamidopyrimidine-DNA glycosylase
VPALTVIAGPNGSGKSTLTRSVDFEGRGRLLYPDAIARGLNPLPSIRRGHRRRKGGLEADADYLNRGVSFAVETTLSSRNRVDLILTDPRIVSGVGNAYSDGILHAARLSPLALTRKLTGEEWAVGLRFFTNLR